MVRECSSFKFRQVSSEKSFKTMKGRLYAFPAENHSEVHFFSLKTGEWKKHSR